MVVFVGDTGGTEDFLKIVHTTIESDSSEQLEQMLVEEFQDKKVLNRLYDCDGPVLRECVQEVSDHSSPQWRAQLDSIQNELKRKVDLEESLKRVSAAAMANPS